MGARIFLSTIKPTGGGILATHTEMNNDQIKDELENRQEDSHPPSATISVEVDQREWRDLPVRNRVESEPKEGVVPVRSVTVLGAGSWGTAIALVLARNGHEVQLVGRPGDALELIKLRRVNEQYLPGFHLPENINVVPLDTKADHADFLVVALPSFAIPSHTDIISQFPVILLASKGLVNDNNPLLSDYVETFVPSTSVVAAITGPNLAKELAAGIPTASVIGSLNQEVAEMIRLAFNSRTLRVYKTTDIRGIELAGALKNVYAIGAGMSDGLGYGDNTKGAFLARSLGEMSRIGRAMGCQQETFLGLAGVGDLFATANSKLSRNYRVGFALGQGEGLTRILENLGQVAEGVPTAYLAWKLCEKLSINAILIRALLGVMFGASPKEAVEELMNRDTPTE